MVRRDTKQGCLGCATLLALIVAIVIVLIIHYAPPVMRNVANAYGRRLLDTIGVDTKNEKQSSKEGIGYSGQQLNESQQDAYLQLLGEVESLKHSIAVYETDPDDIDPAYKALIRDHPELFWLNGSCTYTYSSLGDVVTVELGLNMSLDDVPDTKARIEAAADELMANVPEGASAYEVARAAYERLIESTDYNIAATQNQNIQSVFLNHASVCAGYTRAYQYLLQRRGLTCAYVEGVVTTTGEDHAWNLIQIDGQYAYVDATWGDPTYTGDVSGIPLDSVIYDYFCLTTEEITRDHHVFADEAAWPVCDSYALDYYRVSGLFFDEYSESAVGESFLAQSQAHPGSAYFKFGSDEAYEQAVEALNDGTFVRDQLISIAQANGEDAIVYHYAPSDALHIVKLYW